MVSIKDVAKHAGVAISTVSKVLNHYPNVSEKTKKKVNDAIEELGFIPNTIASALSSKQSTRIALLIDVNRQVQAIDEVFMQYIMGAINQARLQGLDVITIFFSMLDHMSVEEVIRYFRAQNIAGIVIYGMSKHDTILHQLVESKVFKIVLVDAPIVNESTSVVQIDHEKAQYDVAAKTIETDKHKRILYITGKPDGYVTEARLKGITTFVEEHGLMLQVENGNFSEKKAREITFSYGIDADCIVCGSDMMAIGAMKALIDLDIFHPVCGFDGISLMGYVGKQMHTVKQDFYEISSQAIKEIHTLIEGGCGRMVTMPHTLVRIDYLDIIQ